MIINLEGSERSIANNDKISLNSDESIKSNKFNINSYLDKDQRAYEVLKNSDNCEEHNQISYILPLVRSTPKFILFIILNICTVGIINLFVVWFPKIILYIYYKVTYLNNATHFGIFSKHDKDFRVVEKKIVDLPKIDYNGETSVYKKFNFNIEDSSTQIIMFEYNLFKYLYSSKTDEFESINYYIKASHKIIVEKYSTGLNPIEVSYMRKIFGICDLDIKLSSCGKILFDELTDPFYLCVLYLIILWTSTGYYYFAIAIIIVISITLILSVYDSYQNRKKIEEISRYSCTVKVYRKNKNNELMEGVEMNSTELVPGDVFEIPEDGLAMPCDAILISGSVIVNESMLTGESTPVIKVRMTSTDDIYDTTNPDYEKYVLFAGTKVIQKRKIGNNEPMGIVLNTGFNTFKGNLIAGILYPKKDKSNFTRDSVKYIIIMGIMTLVGFGISLKFLIVEGENTATEIIERFFDLVTTAIPPSLPACLSIGITYSLSRLKDKGIFCIQRDRVNKAGSVNILVFDKTGTLTEDHLDIKGFVTTKINENKKFEFNNFTESCENYSNIIIDHFKQREKSLKNFNKDLLQYYVECLACCHCLTYVKDKLIGDPIDVRMFESTGWIMKENSNFGNSINLNPLVLCYIRPKYEEDIAISFQENRNIDSKYKNRYEIAIVKRFDFSSKLQRMTVVCKNLNEKFFKVFCKGSPEKIRELCEPSTIPESFNDILNNYTTRGYRVLGMAGKSLTMNFQQSQTITREAVEKNMLFLGLLIVQNKLKEKTKESLEKFDNADLRMIMATGDNILTAICVSKECNLIKRNTEMTLCDIENVNGVDKLKWEKLEDDNNNDLFIFKSDKIRREVSENEELNKNISTTDNNDILKIITKANNTLYDLYPPENIKSAENKQVTIYKKNIKKKNQNNLQKKEDDKNSIGSSKHSKFSQGNKNTFIPKLIIEEKYPSSFCKDDTCGIAISGSTFERLFLLNEHYTKKKDDLFKNAHNAFRLIIKNGRVFARMAPEHKALLLEALKKEGFTTLMCGDGANDCSALRTAHVSISLSEEEASIAANFTSKIPNVSSVYELLREGKCSLATSIQTFKFMMLYSMIEFFCVTLMMIKVSYLSDFQFIMSDIIIVFPLEIFLAMTKPYSELTYHYPNANLFSFPIITSVITHSFIVLAFQIGGYYILKNHYKWENICDFDEEDAPLPCHENTILFEISLFQYLGVAIAFLVSKPFKQRIYTNLPLMIYLIGIYFYSIWLTINCDSWSKDIFIIYDLEKRYDEDEEEEIDNIIPGGKNMKYYILIMAGVNTFINIIFEWLFMRLINNCYENRQIEGYKKEIEKEKALKEGNNDESKNKDVKIYKYQRIYYNKRRKNMNK